MLVFWRRRAATQRWLRRALGGVVLVAVLGTTIAVGVAARQPDVAVRAALRSASAVDGSMVWERHAATDSAAADAAARSRIRRAFGAAPSPSRRARWATRCASRGRTARCCRCATTPRCGRRHPDCTGSTAGSSRSTRRGRALGVSPGDTLRLLTDAGDRELTVAAVWRPTGPRAPIWNGIGAGSAGTVARVVLSPAELAADGIELTARWSIAPDPARVHAAQLPSLATGYARLAASAAGSLTFAHLEGGGAGTVAALRRGADAAAAVVPVPVALLAAGALLALLLLVRLLAEVRTEETELLRARGAARAQIAGGDLRAALLPVLAGAVVGWVAAQALLLVVAPPAGVLELVLPFLVPTTGALLVVVVASFLAAAPEHAGGGRGGRVAGVAGAALLGVLAIVGVARLVGAGVGADPAAELAPALVIAALVVAGLLLSAPLAAAWDAVARRRDGVAAPLAARRLRRRPGLVAGALVLVALAVGASGFAAGAVASSAGFLRDAGRLVTGGDVDVEVPGAASVAAGTPAPDVARLARIAHAAGSAPALTEQVAVGDLAATLTAAPVARLGALQDRDLAALPALAGLAGRRSASR
ncbi:hypothetical protein GCM10025881_23360 [Pseudolysinimonas kribbensis]|uniref:ABC3 transporter permease C-terminal domain-containing protein n=1 Tax=Pseudolysinimonas kribbensis TaxID=433641 RepID=A0ABQ6K6D3_9MICO|nr:FtsX-like permease family protein [Pseudolysinimonas kribbensis]GMA95512.1 hypothetical protein GCM10025881_23360 [Pseudolysinimonas kribbensis]